MLGPLIGTLAAVVYAIVAVVVWVQHGEPDFSFRGWHDVEANLQLGAIVGGVTGIPLGGVLMLFEWLTRRRIRIVWFVLHVLAFAFWLIPGVLFVW